jgi:P27 family predicted phage terminase small subunit
MGRLAKPTSLKALEGNPGRRPLPKNEPLVGISAGKPPAWLSADALIYWDQIAAILIGANILSIADETALGILCDQLAIYVKAKGIVEKEGITYSITNKSGDSVILRRPELEIANVARDAAMKIVAQLGMTPTMRSKVQKIVEKKGDPLEEFMSPDTQKRKWTQ